MKNFEISEILRLRHSQSEAQRLAWEIANQIEVGMNEWDVHSLAREVFKDNGVQRHWHMPYIGLGSGTNKLRSPYSLCKSFFNMHEKLKNNDLVMIDIAPMIEGYPSDFTVSKVIGLNAEYDDQIAFTKQVAREVMELAERGFDNKTIYRTIKMRVSETNRYQLGDVPLIRLGHRLLRIPPFLTCFPETRFLYLLSYPGPSFLNGKWKKALTNLWALEPYVVSPTRGTKYEELVYIDEEKVLHRLNQEDI